MSTLSDVTVAVLGLGAMGLPMAANLVGHGAIVRGYDIAPARLDLAIAAGVTGCGSARAAATGADVVLLAVRNAAQLEDALYGPDGVIETLPAGATVLLTSTVGVEAVHDVADRSPPPGTTSSTPRSPEDPRAPGTATCSSPSAPTTRLGTQPNPCCRRWRARSCASARRLATARP